MILRLEAIQYVILVGRQPR